MDKIEQLIELSKLPLKDKWLEGLQRKYNERHNYYRFLYHLVSTYRPAIALEIGTWYGIASAYMCAAAKSYGGQVIGLDINPCALANSINEHYDNYHFLQMDSTNSLTIDVILTLKVIHGLEPIGLVYQDSSHHYEASRKEWELYRPLMTEGGWWICDDITPAFHDPKIDPPGKGMVEYFNERPGEKMFSTTLHNGSVIGIIRI